MSNTQLQSMTNLADKNIILTGASRGVGAFIARELAKKKTTIICISRSQDGLDRICDEINTLGGKGMGITFDISKIERIPELMCEIKQMTGSGDIDILINNAGIEIYRAFKNYSLADIQLVMSVNLMSAIELTRLLLPNMLNKGSGHIVNIASLAAKKSHRHDSIYTASKAGLLMWADALKQELADTNIEVSNICPGQVYQQELLADIGFKASSSRDMSNPEEVAIAVCNAIEQNEIEVVTSDSIIMQNLSKILLATERFIPKLADRINRYLGTTELNTEQINSSHKNEKYLQPLEANQVYKKKQPDNVKYSNSDDD